MLGPSPRHTIQEGQVTIPFVRAAAVLAAVLFAGQANAQSPIMSVNHIVTNNMPHYECMRRAANTLRIADTPQFDTTSSAVWGRSRDGRYMVTIYCLTTRDVAMVAAAGQYGNVTASLVDGIMAAWQRSY
jgi:hypothetical protein